MRPVTLLLMNFFVFVLRARSTASETRPPYSFWLSGGGIVDSCDFAVFSRGDFHHLLTPLASVGKPPLIYFHVNMVRTLSQHIHQLSYPFVLVTGSGDYTNPDDLFVNRQAFTLFISSPNIIHWFAQNCAIQHPKLTPIPIGLNFHTLTTSRLYWGEQSSPLQQEAEFNAVRREAQSFDQRIHRCYGNFHHVDYGSKFGYSRRDAVRSIPPACVDYETSLVARNVTWKHQSRYAFVVSPHGNGLDCHRTWEALILGCVVIVKSSPLDGLYEGLPVVVVKEWSDISQGWLRSVVREYSAYNITMPADLSVLPPTPIPTRTPTPPTLLTVPLPAQRTRVPVSARQWQYEKLTLAYWQKMFRAATAQSDRQQRSTRS